MKQITRNRSAALLASMALLAASCSHGVRSMAEAYEEDDRAQFLSSVPDRLQKVDALIAARAPRQVDAKDSLAYASAVADLEYFFARVEECHPGYSLALGGEAGWSLLKTKARAWLAHFARDGRIAKFDAYLALYHAAAAIEDGHTSPSIHWSDGAVPPEGTTMPPFLLAVRQGQWVIAGGAGALADKTGAGVSSIDGKDVDALLEPALFAISAENATWRRNVFCSSQAFFYGLADPLAGRARLRVGFADGTFLEAPCVSTGEFGAITRTLPEPTSEAGFSTPRPEIAVYTYNSFDAGKAALASIDATFDLAAKSGARHLIIDLRNNGGGNSEAGDRIIANFYRGAYAQFRKVIARYSVPVAERYAGDLSASFNKGTWQVWKIEPETTPGSAPAFAGKVHILIGPGTFSSASDFAATFKDFAMGEVWGSETGGVRTCHGDKLSFKTPYAEMNFSVSWKTFFGPKPVPMESRRGVIPDHEATAEALAPYADSADPELAWVVASLR